MGDKGSGSFGGRGLGTSTSRVGRPYAVERAASYAVEQLEQRVMLTGVAGTTTVDAGAPYGLGLVPDVPARAGYRVTWGTGETPTNVSGAATSFPAHAYNQAGTYRPIVEALDANGDPIAGTQTPLAFDPTFGDRGRVGTLFYRPGTSTPATNAGFSVVQQPDGKLLVGGISYRAAGAGTDYLLARYRADGSLDTAFGSSGKVVASFYAPTETAGSSEVYKVALQRNGKVLVVGTAYSAQSRGKDLAVARYNPDGSLDGTFGDGGVARLDLSVGSGDSDDVAYDAAVQGDGKIILVGSTKAGMADCDFAVVRLSTYGELDTTFGQGGITRVDLSGADDVARGVAVTSQGKMLVGGQAGTSFGLTRLLADGQLDTTFDGYANGAGTVVVAMPGGAAVEVRSMAVQGDGRIVLAGRSAAGTEWDYGLARFNADGTLDVTLNPGGTIDGGTAGTLSLDLGSDAETAFSVAVQPADGRIVLGGQVSRNGSLQGVVARLNADGTPDAGFGIDGQLAPDIGDVLALGVQADGKVVATSSQGDHALLVRLQPTNTLTVTATTQRSGVAVTPHSGTALGRVQEHTPVVLDLNPGMSSLGAPTAWEVNWGDGQVQTYAGTATTAVHVYTGAPNSYAVTATALDGAVRHQAAAVVVTVGLDRPLAGDVTVLDDAVPAGSTEGESGGTFGWQTSSPAPFSGSASLVSDVSSGMRHHWVDGLPSPTAVNAGDVLYAYVWLDPANPPEMIGLRWKDTTGSWQHGAYWGREAAAATMGMTEGTAGWFSMGRLPAAGGWARLEVSASAVGLEGTSVASIDFVVAGGRAAFDRTGVNRKPTGPGMPTGVVAFAQGGTQVRVEWQDVAGETKYKVLRSSDGVNFAGVGVVAGGSTSFTDTHVAPGTKYWYRVDAYNGTAFTRSAVAAAATPARTTDLAHGLWAKYFDNENTAAPAVAQLEQSLDLNWGDASPVATIRSDHFSGELTGRITPVHASGTGTYTFWVRANSAVRLWVDGRLLIDQAADAPLPGDANRDGTVDFDDLLVLAKNYNGTGKTWAEGDFTGDGLVNFDDLLLLASHNNTVETPFEYPASGGGSTNVIQLAAGQSYDIRLQVVDAYGFGSARLMWQTPLSGATRQDVPLAQLTPGVPGAPAAPLPPTDLVAAVGGPRQVALSWTDQSAGEQGFRIERRMGNSRRWRFVANVGADQETFTDTGLLPNTVYAYRVAAYGTAGQSPFAAAEAVTTAADGSDAVAAPAGPAARGALPHAAALVQPGAAAPPAVGVLRVEIYRDGVLLDTAIGTTFLDRPVEQGVTYAYAIVAYDAAGNRSASVTLTARHPMANASAAAGDPVTIDGPDSVGEGTRVTLRGSLFGAAGAGLTYVWSVTPTQGAGGSQIGEPWTGSGQEFTFTPPDDGTYEVKLQIRDAARQVYTGYRTIVATNAPPKVRITGRTAGAAGRTMIFGSEVSDPAGKLDLALPPAGGGPGATYAWSVERWAEPDDAPSDWVAYSLPAGAVTNRPSFAFVLPAPGTQPLFRARLTVTDDDGGVSAAAVRNFIVVNQASDATTVNTVDLTLPTGEGETVYAPEGRVVAVQPDGKLLVAGRAQGDSTDVESYFTLARLVPTGDGYERDETFGDLRADGSGRRTGYVLTEVIQSDGQAGYGGARGIAVAPDGKIILVGEEAAPDANGDPMVDGWTSGFVVLRYNVDGTPDTTFGDADENGHKHGRLFRRIGDSDSAGARAVVVRPDGRILVGGWARMDTDRRVVPEFALLALGKDGTLDTAFRGGAFTTPVAPEGMFGPGFWPDWDRASDQPVTIRQMALQPDGKLVVGGYASLVAGAGEDFVLARYDVNGQLDTSFGRDGIVSTDFDFDQVPPVTSAGNTWLHSDRDVLSGLVIQPDGKILAAGMTGNPAIYSGYYASATAFARYNVDGSPDTTFGALAAPGGVRTGLLVWDVDLDWDGVPHQSATGVALQPDGRIVVAVDAGGTQGPGYLVRLNVDGTPDNTFGDGTASRPGTALLGGLTTPGSAVWTPDGIAVPGNSGSSFKMTVGLHRLLGAAPAHLRAAAANDGTVGLTWTRLSNAGDGYEVLRWTDDDLHLFAQGAAAPADLDRFHLDYVDAEAEATYVDRDVVPGKRYYYQVVSILAGARKGRSNVAAATAVAPNTKYVWQETVWVPVDGTAVTSSTPLLAGRDYQLRASGEFALSPTDYGPQYRADAEYGLWRPRAYDVRPNGSGVDYGLDIADPAAKTITELADTANHVFWGSPADSTDHAYTIGYRGNGVRGANGETSGRLTFRYRDDNYGDNEVTDPVTKAPYLMKVEVYKAVPSTPTSLSAKADRGASSITLSWKDAPADATYLVLKRWVDGALDPQTRVVAAGATSYVDKGLQANTVYSYRLYAHGADGDSGESNEAVAMVANDPPTIGAIADQTVTRGGAFSLFVPALDDGDGKKPGGTAEGLTYELTERPDDGMAVSATGEITWHPTDPAYDGQTYVVAVKVSDADQAWTLRRFALTVQAPTATFDVAGAANDVTATGAQLSATLSGQVPTGAFTYKWSTTAMPQGAGDPLPAEGAAGPQAAATFTRPGRYAFQVTATAADGSARTSAPVSVQVNQVAATVVVTPEADTVALDEAAILRATLLDQFGRPYTANPYDNTSFSWEIAPGTGTGTLAATVADHATFTSSAAGTASILVTYPQAGGDVTATVSIAVSAAERPSVGTPTVTATSDPKVWTAAVVADNLNFGGEAVLKYTWRVVDGPAGAPAPTFSTNDSHGASTTGVRVWTAGNYVLEVRVYNNQSHLATTAQVTLNTGATLTSVAVAQSGRRIDYGSTLQLSLVGYDQFGQPMSAAALSGAVWTMEPSTVGSVDASTGLYSAPATAPASNADEGTGIVNVSIPGTTLAASASIRVSKPVAPTVHLRPLIDGRGQTLTVLDRDAQVLADVTGGGDADLPYTLTATPADGNGGNAIVIRQGVLRPSEGLGTPIDVGTLSPTLLADGAYDLKLVVGSNNVTGEDKLRFEVRTELRLGNLTLPSTDLTVNTSGMPITVSRIYDSLRASRGDRFGAGWRSELDDVDLRITTGPGAADSRYAPNYPSLHAGDVLYVTLPGGRQEAFVFNPQGLDSGGYSWTGIYLTFGPRFDTLNGTGSTFVAKQETVGTTTKPYYLRQSGGEYFADATGVGYNPANPAFGGGFTIKARDGTTYTIATEMTSSGLVGRILSIEDLNHDKLEITGDGSSRTIRHSRGTVVGSNVVYTVDSTVTYTLDGHGRVVDVEDPNHKHVSYRYEPTSGALVGVLDRRLQPTTYLYNDLLQATRPAGEGQSVYAIVQRESDGYAWQQVNGAWQFAAYNPQTPGAYAINLTDLGNRWRAASIPGSGGIATGTKLRITYRLHTGTSYAANDAQAAPVETREWLGRPGYLTGVIDPRGVTILSATYDAASGELKELKDVHKRSAPVGGEGYNGANASRKVTDLAGNATEMIYDDRGSVLREIAEVKDATGRLTGYSVTVHAYSYRASDGGLTQTKDGQPFFVGVTEPLTTRYSKPPAVWQTISDYDVEGNVYRVSTPNPAGGSPLETRMDDFNALGRPETVTDAYGQVTRTHYDAAGHVLWTINPLGEGTEYTYTSTGQPWQTFRVRYVAGNSGTPIVRLDVDDDHPTGKPNSSNAYYTADDLETNKVVGLLKSATDFSGVSTRYTYYPDGQVKRTFREWSVGTTPHSVQESFTEYDDEGRATATTDAFDHTTRTIYDALGQAVESIDAHGNHTYSTYDASGHLIETRETHVLAASIQEFGRNDNGSLRVTTTDPHGLTTGDQVTFVPASGGAGATWTISVATESSFDLLGTTTDTPQPGISDPIYVTDAVTRTAYDAMGRAEWTVDRYKPAGDPATDPGANGTHTLYDALGRAWKTERVANVVIAIELDTDPAVAGAGLLRAKLRGAGAVLSTSSTTFDGAGRVATQTGPDGQTTSYEYNADGSTKSVTDALRHKTTYASAAVTGGEAALPGHPVRKDAVTDSLNHTTTTYYDAVGRAVRTTYADGTFTQTLYGVAGNPVQNRDADDVGMFDIGPDGEEVYQIITGQQVTKIDQLENATDYFYDPQGRLTDVWLPAVDDATTPETTPVRPHWHYEYDAHGNQTAQTLANTHQTTTFDYGLPNTGDLYYASRTARHLPGDTTARPEVEHDTYDTFGRPQTHTDFKGNVTRFIYDDDATVAPAERLGLGRLVHKKYFDPAGVLKETVHYTYDALGRTTSVTDNTGTTSYQYDAEGHTTAVASPQGTIHYEYDPATGQHTGTWTGTGPRAAATTDTAYEYDELGRLKTVKAAKLNGAAPTGPSTTLYTYDAAGNLDTVALPNGIVTDYDYDDLNRLTLETIKRPDGTKEQTYDYELLDDGKRDYVVETRYQANGATLFSKVKIDWAYDDLGRLTQEKRDEGDDTIQNGGDYTADYAYDLAGNRLSKAFDSADNTKDETIGYTYNADDQLKAEDSSVNANDATYTYDLNGSLETKTQSGQTTRYTWDVQNRLTGVDANGDGDLADPTDAAYAYDANGVRTRKTVGGVVTNFVNDDLNPTGYSKPVEERGAAGNVLVTYVLGHDILAQAKATDAHTPKYLLKDGHGTTRLLANADATVVERYNLDAFGTPLNFDPDDVGTSWLAPDGRTDAETSFTYSLARYRVGFRFISLDDYAGDAGEPLTLHRYIYGNDNPILYVDPSGNAGDLNSLNMTMGKVTTLASILIQKVLVRASPYIAGLTLYSFLRDPAAAQEFIATGGNPAELAQMFITDLKAVATDAKSVIALGRSLYNDSKGLGIAAREVGQFRGVLSNLEGVYFESEVLRALGLGATSEAKATVQVAGKSISTIPDLGRNINFGVTEMKDVVDIAITNQIRAQQKLAANGQLPYNLIVSPKAETISESVQNLVKETKGIIVEFNPITGLWKPVTFDPEKPARIVRN